MFRLLNAATVAAVALTLGFCATPAPAAKGVKKNGEHHVTGKIVAVHHGKAGAGGTLIVHVPHHKQKKGLGVVVKKGHDHTFTINPNTRVMGVPAGRPQGIAALHAGQHVTVHAHRHHADAVAIHHHHKKKLRVAKG
jgi:hypothetical protein